MTNQTINYFIEKTDYGLYVKFSGQLCKYNIKDWFIDIKLTKGMKKNFGLILDLRGVKPICHDVARMLTYGRAYLHGHGLNRVVIVYDTSATIIELMRLFAELGYDPNEKHISSTMNTNWKEIAEKWVRDGIEP
jgi:hypothetical protein